MTTDSATTAQDLVTLARLCVDFARVRRKPCYPDGQPESDVEHSFMLGLVALALAKKYFPTLDEGLVAQFAYVHDLIELRIGDTHTYGLSAQEATNKAARESAAMPGLLEELAAWPGLVTLVKTYERQDCPEARFVRIIDKIMPALTNILDQGRTLQQEYGTQTKDELAEAVEATTKRMSAYAVDQAEALAIRKAVTDLMLGELFDEEGHIKVTK